MHSVADRRVGPDEPLCLGVDIGSSSSKGVVTDVEGNVIVSAQRAHSIATPVPGWAEHDADAVWWEEFRSLCQELTTAARPGRIAAVATSGIGPSVLLADRQERPLRPAILYGIDRRATSEIEELNAQLGSQSVLDRCGSPLTTQAVGPKLLWLARNAASVWSQSARWYMASSYLVARLTGAYVIDHHSASQSVPLYDTRAGAWIEEWSQRVAPGLPLPTLLWPSDVAGRVTKTAAEATGLEVGTPVATGTIDAWAEALSVGAASPGSTMLMYGTTMFIVAGSTQPHPHPGLWCTAGIWPGSWSLAAGMATSGALTTWFHDLVKSDGYEPLLAAAAQVPAGANGLVVLPYFAGERTPLFDPLARGVIAGLTLQHGQGEIYRALLEATAFGVRHNLEAMKEAGARIEELVAVGGGTRSDVWAQIVSDVTGHPQELRRERIGACYGDALLAGVAAGLVAKDANWNPTCAWVTPSASIRSRYDELYEIYRSLYSATTEQVHALARFQDQHRA